MALQDRVNTAPADGAEAWYEYIQLKLSCGWEGVSRGEGTGAGTGRITTFDGTAPAWAATSLQGPNAWAIIKRTGTDFALRITRSADAADWSKWSVSHAAQGYDATGDEDTPDAENVVGDSKDLWASVGAETQMFPADGTYRCHCVGEDSAAYGGYLVCNLTGTTDLRTFVLVESPSNQWSGDNAPFVFYADYEGTGNLLRYPRMGQSLLCPRAWAAYGLGAQAWCDALAAFPQTVTINCVSNHPVDLYGSGKSSLRTVTYYLYDGFGVGPLGEKGDSRLMCTRITTGLTNGTMVDDATTSFRWAVLGDFMFRWPTDPAKAMVL